VAYALKRDPLDIRKANFYGTEARNVTPYHQTITDNIIARLVDELEAKSDYQERRADIIAFNRTSPVIRRGIGLTPVKFGISFTATWFNQAGALIHIYRDGSIHLNHGGTEMGQGLNTKIAQIVASEFGVELATVKITATHTGKVPNTSATAASSGSDLNGAAAKDACDQIKKRLARLAAEMASTEGGAPVAPEAVEIGDGEIRAGNRNWPFDDFIEAAYMARTQLSAAGFYATPDISWDRAAGRGEPFFYFAYGAAVSEVSIDTLTGEYHVDRVDILHDVGKSLNPALDKGQIEGGFIQGQGWLTTEELIWDDKGLLKTHAPSTYKIPLASDVAPVFNVELAEWSVNPARTIKRSKAVGEPPLMLATSVLEALSMAVASVADYGVCPRLDTPATPERVLMAVRRLEAEGGD
jgi:xanthine dehydrogenase large subunit